VILGGHQFGRTELSRGNRYRPSPSPATPHSGRGLGFRRYSWARLRQCPTGSSIRSPSARRLWSTPSPPPGPTRRLGSKGCEAFDRCQASACLPGIASCTSRASGPRGRQCKAMQGDANKSARHDANEGRMTEPAGAVTQIPLQFGRNDANDGRDGRPRTARIDRETITRELQKSGRTGGGFRLTVSRKDGSCVYVQANRSTAQPRG